MSEGKGLPSASILENAQFNALVVVPNALQGIFKRRERAVGIATAAGVDRRAVSFLGSLRRKHAGSPVWVRVGLNPAILVFRERDIKRVLGGSPDPFAPDPEAKRDGMIHFQPDAATISRGKDWESRRAFCESVLETGADEHSLGERFEAVVDEEVDRMLADCGEVITFEPFHHCFQRITRRVIFGDTAADRDDLTELLGELMEAANGMPGERADRLGELEAGIAGLVEAGEEGSLASRFADAPVDERTEPVGQVPHWMFAMGDSLPTNAFRALVLLAADPLAIDSANGNGGALLEGTLEEAMRLWPTTAMLSRVTIAPIEWGGQRVEAGTQVVIVNTFNHRDPDGCPFADEFSPEEWTEGDAPESWRFNQLSHGPQGCPGAGLAKDIGVTALARILEQRELEGADPDLDLDAPLPHSLDFFSAKVRVG
ncbi:MAG: cytochrome P450 [Solirubrobacterales bacterium]